MKDKNVVLEKAGKGEMEDKSERLKNAGLLQSQKIRERKMLTRKKQETEITNMKMKE